MVIKRVQLFSLVAIILSALSIVGFARFGPTVQEAVKPGSFGHDPALKDPVNYRQWTRVNDKPLEVVDVASDRLSPDFALSAAGWNFTLSDISFDVIQTSAAASTSGITISSGTTRIILAGPPRRAAKQKREKDVAHEQDSSSFGVVYVNEVARHALLNEKRRRFPVGSVIVREKLARPGDTRPQVVVVMVKREPGFNRKANDWEFFMLDGSVSEIRHREKTGDCRSCHARQKDTDFVFRSYLPKSVPRH